MCTYLEVPCNGYHNSLYLFQSTGVWYGTHMIPNTKSRCYDERHNVRTMSTFCGSICRILCWNIDTWFEELSSGRSLGDQKNTLPGTRCHGTRYHFLVFSAFRPDTQLAFFYRNGHNFSPKTLFWEWRKRNDSHRRRKVDGVTESFSVDCPQSEHHKTSRGRPDKNPWPTSPGPGPLGYPT